MHQIKLLEKETIFRNLLIKTRLIEAKFNLQKSLKELIKAVKNGKSIDIIDWAFIYADINEKYLKIKKLYKEI
ncbi:hypothetical protein IJ843_05225 [bacterium]|nr:hypothetical protein [bacterium]